MAGWFCNNMNVFNVTELYILKWLKWAKKNILNGGRGRDSGGRNSA